MRLLIVPLLAIVLAGSGCIGLLTRSLGGPESPRPKEYQVIGAKETTVPVVKVLAAAQNRKVEAVEVISGDALASLKDATPEQAEAITNVVANAVKAVEAVDGTAKYTSKLAGGTVENILDMDLGDYLAYTTVQGVVASRNQQAVYEGAKLGVQWTKGKVAGYGGLGALIVGLGTLAGFGFRGKGVLKLLNKKRAEAVERFAQENKVAGKKLKQKLAIADSTVPVDASKYKA